MHADDSEVGRSSGRGSSRFGVSNRWFAAAVAATLVSGGLILGVFVGLQRSPFVSGSAGGISGGQGSAEPLVFAVARTPGGPGEWSNWARVIKHVSEDIGRPVTVRYLTKEDEAATVIEHEDIDVAFVCSHHYLNLSRKGVVEGLCVPLIDNDPTCSYMLLVAQGDVAEGLEDLEGAAIAVSDKSSLGGYSYLSYICEEHDLVPVEFFGEVRLGATQEQNLRDLGSGEVRATVVNSAQVSDWDLSAYKVIEESPRVGVPPVVVSTEMDPAIRKSIADAFLAFQADVDIDAASHIDGFIPFDDALYDYAREIEDACGHHEQ